MNRVMLMFLFTFNNPACAAPDADAVAGRVVAQENGQLVELPLLHSDISIQIDGDMATVELRQTFENPTQIPLQAEYLFPLNQNAAVYGMQMRIGDETITARIREKAKAEAEFKQAAQDGKAAALLTQHRPNMFTQKIANLMPGLPVEVRLSYVQMVPEIDGRFELVIPLVVGPRYESPNVQIADDHAPLPEGEWSVSQIPAYPSVVGLDLPDSIAHERVSIDVNLRGGVSVSGFGSDTHALSIDHGHDGIGAQFKEGQVLDNRDLVLHYTLGGDHLQAGSMFYKDERGGFLSVLIEPPTTPDQQPATPRELVFVLDTSGSMSGEPMAASKRFMEAALRGLGPDDYFRIIPFANETRQFSNHAVRASTANIRKARGYVGRLNAGGGTEIDTAIRAAFVTEQPTDTMRIIVFLSDGYIGDEAQVLASVREMLGQSRIYAFGVGTSVNRYLLDAMADEGRGYARYVGLDETASDVAETLALNLKTPVLTDMEIDWGGLEVSDVTPARLPDLFAGQGVRVMARTQTEGTAQITLKGVAQGRVAEMPVRLDLGAPSTQSALPLIWARTRIAALTRQIAVGDGSRQADQEITELGLAFSLQTQNTSFVAVSERIVNATGVDGVEKSVPLPMVSGLSVNAYPQAFAGSSSPEPHAILGFLTLFAMTLLGMRRRLQDALGWTNPSMIAKK